MSEPCHWIVSQSSSSSSVWATKFSVRFVQKLCQFTLRTQEDVQLLGLGDCTKVGHEPLILLKKLSRKRVIHSLIKKQNKTTTKHVKQWTTNDATVVSITTDAAHLTAHQSQKNQDWESSTRTKHHILPVETASVILCGVSFNGTAPPGSELSMLHTDAGRLKFTCLRKLRWLSLSARQRMCCSFCVSRQ